MSTPTGEPMFPARENYGDPLGIASDTRAMQAALKEWIVLQLFQYGARKAGALAERMLHEATIEAIREYASSQSIREAQSDV